MDIIFVLAVAIFIDESCSQVLQSPSKCFTNGDDINLECTTTDFSQVINFALDNNVQGGCAPGCSSNIIQSGITTTYTLSFSSSTHSGNWTCSYGSSVSPVVVIADNPCVETTIGSTEGTPSSSNDLTGGEIAGIVIGVLFFLCTVAIIIYLIILNLKGKPAPITNSVPAIHKPKPNTGKPAPITNSGKPAPITNSVPVIPKPKPDTVPDEPQPKPGNDKLPSITRHDPVEQSMLGHDKPSSIKHHDKLPSIKRNGDPEPRQVHESA